MRRRSRQNYLPKVIVLSSAIALGTVGLGYMALQSIGKPNQDHFGCYEGFEQSQTVVLFDVSEPKFNDEQARSLQRYFKQLYNRLQFNERLSFVTTAEDQVGSIPKPSFQICGQPTYAQELKAIGAESASQGFLAKQKQRLFENILAPALNEIVSPDTESRQRYQSPILEMVAGIRRFHPLNPGDRLVIVSDLIQNSDTVQFCRTQNDMPPFSIFQKKAVYGRLKPASLEAIGIDVLMIQRFGYGESELSFCYSEEEIRRFWRDYFLANGAESPEFIRIRHGVIEG